ncbi:pyridoxal-phosphate-dependent aminotransferase family protein [Acanthopleuribacter pedis]|uniref:Alanine--glyoxylate aminotransferase family protein n=1 Tax=Acanthopleuribacter pedis TaxID=442870 RepID=A0A8J7Q8V4_9BACT|nr:alanine--glyoxylate aminotransferase family protein [Acanthopleuribacter pedis]MBO1319569.1 alanine--glyoxylate aminotransferase family protein [Acanthopleuribacter pedis]
MPENQSFRQDYPQLDPPVRTLMGPGPSDIHPRVLQAMAAPTIGHLDPAFIQMMDQIQGLLQQLFQTKNALTFPVSGTGSAGMECCMVNVIEPGDRVVIAQNGVFGGRMADIADRLGADVVKIQVPFGQKFEPEAIREAVAGKPTKLVGVVHAETSTGVCQSLPEIAEIAHEVDALLLADCVTSLGGTPVKLDEWGVDLAYSGTQKCLSCPPGLAPVSFSERAVQALKNRKSKVVSWYLDVSMLLNYWGGERAYHHTAPINMLYGLREALLIVLEEGLDAVFARHQHHGEMLVAGVEAMGLSMLVPADYRLPQLNTVVIPDGVDDAAVRRALLNDYNIEIGGGLGDLKGKVWRVGLMGHASRRENVVTFLAALESILVQQGAAIQPGAGLAAAAKVGA